MDEPEPQSLVVTGADLRAFFEDITGLAAVAVCSAAWGGGGLAQLCAAEALRRTDSAAALSAGAVASAARLTPRLAGIFEGYLQQFELQFPGSGRLVPTGLAGGFLLMVYLACTLRLGVLTARLARRIPPLILACVVLAMLGEPRGRAAAGGGLASTRGLTMAGSILRDFTRFLLPSWLQWHTDDGGVDGLSEWLFHQYRTLRPNSGAFCPENSLDKLVLVGYILVPLEMAMHLLWLFMRLGWQWASLCWHWILGTPTNPRGKAGTSPRPGGQQLGTGELRSVGTCKDPRGEPALQAQPRLPEQSRSGEDWEARTKELRLRLRVVEQSASEQRLYSERRLQTRDRTIDELKSQLTSLTQRCKEAERVAEAKEEEARRLRPAARLAAQVCGVPSCSDAPACLPRAVPTFHCAAAREAEAFLEAASIPACYLSRAYDRCYCPACYGREYPDVIAEGKARYVVPRGWVGIGLKLPPRGSDPSVGMFGWSVSFHGTNPAVARQILHNGSFAVPGDKLLDGSTLKSVHSAGRQDSFFYTSPTVSYAGLQLYSEPILYRNGTMLGQMVLMCRQNEATLLRKQSETMKFLENGFPEHYICRHTSLRHGIEWLSQNRTTCIPYRILIRTFPSSSPPLCQLRSPVDRSPGHKGRLWL